jgi:hypothetical protein
MGFIQIVIFLRSNLFVNYGNHYVSKFSKQKNQVLKLRFQIYLIIWQLNAEVVTVLQ